MTLVSIACLQSTLSPTSARPSKRPDCACERDFNGDFDNLQDDTDWADFPPELDDPDSEVAFDPEPTDDDLLDEFELDGELEEIPPPEDLWNEADWE